MRELTMSEMSVVSGACSEGGVLDGITPETVGGALINIYEGAIAATSYVIERVANAL